MPVNTDHRLFAPDAHSVIGPRWDLATPNDATQVRAVLSRYGVDETVPINDVEQAQDGTINSRNYRIPTLGLVIKRKAAVGHYSASLRYAQRALRSGLPMPQHYQTETEACGIMDFDGTWWCVMAFLPGRTFSGSLTQLASAGEMLLRLYDVLAIAPDRDDQLPRRTVVSDDMLHWCERAGVGRHHIVPAEIEALRRGRLRVTHIDLHSHNLLFVGSQVSGILDVESLQRAPSSTALGYAVFKLVRQSVVNGVSPSAALTVLDHATGGLLSTVRLREGAKAEILRRIAYIAEAESRGQREWMIDLSKHLVALDEIEEIFTS